MLPVETCPSESVRSDRLEVLARYRDAAASRMRACAFLAVAVLLAAALLPTLCPQAAWAEEGAVPQVVGSFDKESYAAGEGATVTFRVTNDGTAAAGSEVGRRGRVDRCRAGDAACWRDA